MSAAGRSSISFTVFPIVRLHRLLLLAALCAPGPLAAQPAPSLPRDADPRDWESYFDLGNRLFERNPRQAAAAFEWAARLDPTRAEPLLGRWAAYFAADQGSWRAYLDEDPEILRRPGIVRNDSLYARAMLRNPFVHRGLEVALYAMLGRELRWDGATVAFMEYGRGRFDRAATSFARAAGGNPGRNAHLLFYRALSLVGAGDLDGAAREVERLLSVLRDRDERRVGFAYQSKASLEHALGRLHEERGRPGLAREAYERALLEDLAYHPARQALGRLALAAGDPAAAVEHLAAAAEAAPLDGVVRFEHGNALYAAGRLQEAAAEYLAAVEREPFYADIHLRLGLAYENLGEPARALTAYRAYLERAPRKQEATAARVRERVAALAAGR